MADEPALRELVEKYAVPQMFAEGARVEVEEEAGPSGGFSGEMKKFTLRGRAAAAEQSADVTSEKAEKVAAVVVKNFPAARRPASKQLGLAREGVFYAWFPTSARVSPMLSTLTPKMYHAMGDMETGAKVLVMEDLRVDGVSLSSLYGKRSPVNWGKDVDPDIRQAYVAEFGKEAPMEEMQLAMERLASLKIASAAARLHALYWHPARSESTITDLPTGWLNGSWFRSQDEGARMRWQGTLDWAVGAWRRFLAEIQPKAQLELDPRLISLIDKSILETTWQNYLTEIAARPWTLIHGDFHPGNMIWRLHPTPSQSQVVFFDFEAVGYGCGPQEIAQALISHASPASRRTYEKEVLDTYYQTLLAELPAGIEFPRAEFEEAYVKCGLGRWLWLLFVCATGTPPPAVKYFMEQIVAFCEDHGVFEKGEAIMIRP